jgi:2-methylisocitrate lyase-like PEP mutase family enzyme
VGLLTMTEMVGNAARIVGATGLPVIADADTGYGNPLNVVRTVQQYERAGVGGIHLEDQVAPKKCGHVGGKQVIPTEEMVAKIRAAVATRECDDFVLIARTDARAVDGLRAALDRALRYRDAGADVLFVEALENEEEVETTATELGGFPMLFNWVEGGKTPAIGYDRLRELGFRLIIFPVGTLLAATQAMRTILAEIRAAGTPIPIVDRLLDFHEFVEFIGLPEIQELERRFTSGSSGGPQ